MGKPLREGAGEIEKCALVCEYYASNCEQFLAPDHVGQVTHPPRWQFECS
jgi:succinate-semialdehyde dehydrogenase/glutarate-semialdehyde dehydrogenase